MKLSPVDLWHNGARNFFCALIYLCSIIALHTNAIAQDFQPAVASYVLSPTVVKPGDFLSCRFLFTNRGTQPSRVNERIFFHFIPAGQEDSILWQYDHDPQIPTRYWMTGQAIEDGPFSIRIPDEIQDGTYAIHLGLWNPSTAQRSLEKTLPLSFQVNRSTPTIENATTTSVDPVKARLGYRNLMLQRFMNGDFIRLENNIIQVQLSAQRGIFCIRRSEAGSFWQSAPGATELGFVMAERDGRTIRIPLNDLVIVKETQRACTLRKEFEGSGVMEIEIHLDGNNPAAQFSWKALENWTIASVNWNDLLWTTDGLGGGAIIPRLKGEFFSASTPSEWQYRFETYNGWGGLHIPMCGILHSTESAYISWVNPSINVNLRARSMQPEDDLGEKWTSISIQGTESTGVFRMELLDGSTYVHIARAYAEQAEHDGLFVSMKKKVSRDHELEKLLGAANVKPFVCIRWAQDPNGTANDHLQTNYTEQDCLELARHLHDDLELDKVLFTLAGWIHRGYDNQHPDILPAAPEIGGNEGVAKISEYVRSLGYLFGLHDNYQDMYEDAPSWDATMIMMNLANQRMKGGVWAGGQSWLIASNYGLQLAKRNLPEVKKLFQPTAYFIDTTYAAPLYESFDPDNPLTREEDLRYKCELSRYAASLFGAHGSETGYAFGAPISQYFEGILSGNELIQDFPNPGAQEIPLFPLIFHDSIVLYTHQGDRAGLGDARQILKLLLLGAMPIYDIPPHQYWQETTEEPDLSNPAYCFANGKGGWGEGRPPMDCFIKNTYTFLSPFAKGVAMQPMTDHRYLREDRSVEQSRFGDYWQVIVNYGPGDYRYGETLLPPMGFIAIGPDFLAQHYYPDYGKKNTSLVVKNGDVTYIGFH